jgi:hypothetical protein
MENTTSQYENAAKFLSAMTEVIFDLIGNFK